MSISEQCSQLSMAYIQFFLPLLHWTDQEITTNMSKAMDMIWKNKASKKAFRLLKMEYICSPWKSGGLNVLNIHYHALSRKMSLLLTFFKQEQPWTKMLSYMCQTMQTHSYGKWEVDIWELLIGKFMGKIPGCLFASALIQDWKEVLYNV